MQRVQTCMRRTTLPSLTRTGWRFGIQRRLETARREIERAGEFDVRLLNDDVERAAEQLGEIIRRQFAATTNRR